MTTVEFDPREDINTTRSLSADEIDVTANYNDTDLVKIRPSYAYKHRRMTLKELEYEMIRPSEKWEDFRKEEVEDHEQSIGKITSISK